MICLGTDYFIRALIRQTKEALAVEQWLHGNESLCIPAVAWFEFLCGSIAEDEQLALALLDGGILPFGESEAQSAAAVFRSLEKPRRLRVDAIIAAIAIQTRRHGLSDNEIIEQRRLAIRSDLGPHLQLNPQETR